jgi:hypothetical protein
MTYACRRYSTSLREKGNQFYKEGAGNVDYKYMFKPFESIFTEHLGMFRIEECVSNTSSF